MRTALTDIGCLVLRLAIVLLDLGTERRWRRTADRQGGHLSPGERPRRRQLLVRLSNVDHLMAELTPPSRRKPVHDAIASAWL